MTDRRVFDESIYILRYINWPLNMCKEYDLIYYLELHLLSSSQNRKIEIHI